MYGQLGEVVGENRQISTLSSGFMIFETKYRFDSWGRILEMTYPDDEQLIYSYNNVGQLRNIVNTEGQIYLKDVKYNFFDQPIEITYGNDVRTINEYDITQRVRAMQLNRPDHSSFIRAVYTYDKNQNITNIKNSTSQHSVIHMGGTFNKDYQYDKFNRLKRATGSWDGFKESHNYDLRMNYNATHSIVNKNQIHHSTFNGVTAETVNSYKANYEYLDSQHPHAVSRIVYIKNNGQQLGNVNFKYDVNGNMTDLFNSIPKQELNRRFIWDEQNRLQAVVDNDGQKVSHYVYDHAGERTFKSEGNGTSINIGGENIYHALNFENYVIYPSGSFVFQPAQGRYTKDYYINDKKFASKIGTIGNFSQSLNARSSSNLVGDESQIKPLEKVVQIDNQYVTYGAAENTTPVDYPDCSSQLQQLLQQLFTTTTIHCYQYVLDKMNSNSNPCVALEEVNRYICKEIELSDPDPDPDPGTPTYTPEQIVQADCLYLLNLWIVKANGLLYDENDRYYINKCYEEGLAYVQNNYVISGSNACEIYNYVIENYKCDPKEEIEVPEIPEEIPEDWNDGGANSNTTEPGYDEELRKPIWWYHTDHLGSSSYITDNFGRPSHYYDQLPFGESMVEHNQSSYYNNGYKFNGKELDEATGMYYYGARYYDPRISIFISVDPLAEKYPGWTPYHYVHNNPTNIVDPTGMEGEGWIEWSTKEGDKQMTYDSEITTKEEAVKKGYRNVKDVYTSGYYIDDNDNYHLREDGYITKEDGSFIDTYNNETLRTTDGTFFSKNKTGVEQLLEVTGAFGDGLTYIGYGISLSGAGTPIGLGIAGVGGIISELSTGGSIINDLSNENYVGAASNASGLIISKSIGKVVDKKIPHIINENFDIGNSIIKQNIGIKTKFLIEDPAKQELKKQMLNE